MKKTSVSVKVSKSVNQTGFSKNVRVKVTAGKHSETASVAVKKKP